MCGIVCYIGARECPQLLLNGLEHLEYRGYDSAGMACLKDGPNGKKSIVLSKEVGMIADFKKFLSLNELQGHVGIAHTRWATHGRVTRENAHPHTDCKNQIAVVHNGIIENFAKLRDYLLENGHDLTSETDTEVIAHLIEEEMEKNPKQGFHNAVRAALSRLEGTFAIAAVTSLEPDKIVVARYKSPLVLGIGAGELFAASDIPAFLGETKRVLLMDDGDTAILGMDGTYSVFGPDGKQIMDREVEEVGWSQEKVMKGEFDYFMLKEINEETECVERVMTQDLEPIMQMAAGLKDADRVVMVACGTSRHAAIIGRYLLMKHNDLYCDVVMASEFKHFVNTKLIDENTVVLAISQSGETADVLEAIDAAKKNGARIFSIVNVVGSMIPRKSDLTVYMRAGPELSVVATKTYVATLLVFTMLSHAMKGELESLVEKREELAGMVRETIELNDGHARELASALKDEHSVYFIGRGINFATALEGSLKFKEITYIHAEGMPAGELKHGTLSLIEEGVHVIVVNPRDDEVTYAETVSNAMEVKARGGVVIEVSNVRNSAFDVHLGIPTPSESLMYPLLCVIPLQLLAYYTTIERGLDPDRPRNLAKAVTVK